MKALALVAMIGMVGCASKVAPCPVLASQSAKAADIVIQPDTMSASELAKNSVALQKACGLIGSCSFLHVECVKVNGRTTWSVDVPGANGKEDGAYVEGLGTTLDEAANDFRISLRRDRADKAYSGLHPEPDVKISHCTNADCK